MVNAKSAEAVGGGPTGGVRSALAAAESEKSAGRTSRARRGSNQRGRGMRVVRRVGIELAELVGVMIAVVVLTFLIVRLVPGDPAKTILGVNANPQNLAALRHELRLDEPELQQFREYVFGLCRGDLGTSLVQDGRSVLSIIGGSLPVTLLVALWAVVAAVIIGVPLGVIPVAARLQRVDVIVKSAMSILIGTPTFLTSLLLVLLVSLKLRAAPAGGWGNTAGQHLSHLWLPGFALSLYVLPIVVRTVRQSAKDTWEQPFVEAAITRGLRFRTIVSRHLVPNSLLPLVTLIGYNLGGLIGGAVVIDVVFNLPGLGTRLVDAVQVRDYPVVQGIALVTAIFVVAANKLTDFLYYVIDPRTRLGAV
jgi:peptide/nickel transport system permease protein